jgi:hypothetical protein
VNAAIRAINTDLKAAVRIGHPESIQAALDGLRALPEVASNQTLSHDFLTKALLPLGEVLSNPRLPIDIIKSLVHDSSAALRALAAAAYSLRYLHSGGITPDELKRLANDSRADVRTSLVIGLTHLEAEHQEKVTALLSDWLNSDLTRLQQAALQLIAGLPPNDNEEILPILAPLGSSSHPDTNADLVTALNHLAQDGQAQGVLSLMADWAQEPEPNTWVITRALSASWAMGEVESALNILRQLGLQNAPPKQIAQALQALMRHGAGEVVQGELTRWRKDDDENLRAIADKAI